MPWIHEVDSDRRGRLSGLKHLIPVEADFHASWVHAPRVGGCFEN